MQHKTVLGLAGLLALLAITAPASAQVTSGDCNCVKPVGVTQSGETSADTGKKKVKKPAPKPTTSSARIPVTKPESGPQIIVKHDTTKVFLSRYLHDTVKVTNTLDHYYAVKPSRPGCWSTGKCELITLGALALGSVGYECATNWCQSHSDGGTKIIIDIDHKSGLRRPAVTIPLGLPRFILGRH